MPLGTPKLGILNSLNLRTKSSRSKTPTSSTTPRTAADTSSISSIGSLSKSPTKKKLSSSPSQSSPASAYAESSTPTAKSNLISRESRRKSKAIITNSPSSYVTSVVSGSSIPRKVSKSRTLSGEEESTSGLEKKVAKLSLDSSPSPRDSLAHNKSFASTTSPSKASPIGISRTAPIPIRSSPRKSSFTKSISSSPRSPKSTSISRRSSIEGSGSLSLTGSSPTGTFYSASADGGGRSVPSSNRTSFSTAFSTHGATATGSFVYPIMNLGTLEERLGGSTSTSHKSNPEYSNLKGDLQTLLSMTPRDPYTDLQKYSGPKGGSGRPLVGLTNLGNTCFMNSILQCIFSTSLLTNYFQTGMYKCDLNPQGGCKGQFGKVFADLVGEVFREEGGRVVAPRAFKRELEKWAPQFSGYRQQDSQEFLRFMLDGLAEDLNRVRAKPSWKIKDDDVDLLPDPDKARLSWNRYQSRNSSIIFDIFGGQLQSTVTCLGCSFQSLTFDSFLDLSLPIPSSSSSCDLSDCLKEFTRMEYLDEPYKCSRCKKMGKASKQLTLYKLPEVLVIREGMSVPLIDLKRFKVDSFRRDKIESNVKFPLTSLKLHSSTLSSLECSSLTSSKEEILYDLYGVSNHMGGLGGGHYVAHVLGQGNQWYLMDDSQVSLVGPQLQGNMPSAYVLFYKKRRS